MITLHITFKENTLYSQMAFMDDKNIIKFFKTKDDTCSTETLCVEINTQIQ